MDLPPGQYTVVANDATNPDGIVIVELYDADESANASAFVNISTRGWVGTGNEVLISGFVVAGENPKKLLIRAVGPTLANAPYNVANALVDPKIDIYRAVPGGSDVLVLSSDNWSAEPNAAEIVQTAQHVSAFSLPAETKDAATVATFSPGVYTAVVSGMNGATGIALVEIYSAD
jgi:hypothetical protein